MERKFLVATIICDGTGSRAGIVTARSEQEATLRLGYDVIGHSNYPINDEYNWEEYVERHDSVIGQPYFLDTGSTVIPLWKLYLDREEVVFKRWIMLVPMSEELLNVTYVMIGYERDSHNPRMWFVSNEEAAHIEVSEDLFVEYFIYIDGQLIDADTEMEIEEEAFKV